MTDPNSPAAIARADERRRPEGIEDESIVDQIIDDLTSLEVIRYEPMSGQYWTDDLPDVIGYVIDAALQRASQHVITHGWHKAHGKKDFRHGLYEAAELMKEVPR